VAGSTISYTSAGYGTTNYALGSFNGFDFTGLTFLSGGSLTGFTLTTDIAGLTSSNVTFGPSFIEINLANLPVDDFFTLTLTSSSPSGVPEPSSLGLLATGLLAFAGFALKKVMA
jgi:hypothetical protein